MSDTLETRLAELARDLRVEVSPELEATVAARIGEATPPRSSRLARWLTGLLLALLGAGVVASPVGATILEWFGFHGVAVVEGEPRVTDEPSAPAEPPGTSLDEAAALAGFAPLVPEELGAPDGVAVSGDGRVVSLSWGTGADTVRLDQFRGSIEPYFWKIVDDAEIITIDSGDALWLPHPHEVSVVGSDGTTRTLPPRLAAPTLVWPTGSLTLRLEGHLTLERATEIADSTG